MRRRRRKADPYVPTTSMGDIAFLLIIFFMVCSNFAKEASQKLKPPKAADLQKIQESSISVSIDEQGLIYIQGANVPDEQAIEYGVEALIKDRATEQGRTVMFKCDKSVPREVFEPVIEAISKAGGIVAAMGDPLKENDK